MDLNRWHLAQQNEQLHHTMSYESGWSHYKQSYMNYFDILGIGFDHSDKSIIEIGPAGFPALAYCTVKSGIIVEPLHFSSLERICAERNFIWIKDPLETADIPVCDEIWLLNVLQHVIEPDIFVSRAKELASRVVFFEPVDYPSDLCHPHVLTKEMFVDWFGFAHVYDEKRNGFHQWQCVYGIYDNV